MWQSEYVAANGLRLHVERAGAGPPVVMAHGFSDSAATWRSLGRVVAAHFSVVLVDARGHGRSAAPVEGYDSACRVADLAAVIAALALPPPVLVGHSMGAATVAMLAATRPGLVRALVLEDPPFPRAERDTPELSAAQRHELAEQWRGRLARGLASTQARLEETGRRRSPGWGAEDLATWAAAKRQLSPHIIGVLEAPGQPWQDVVAAISCPTLVLTGDPALGAIVTPEVLAAMRALTPAVRHAHIAGAGHHVRRDQPVATARAVLDFLREVS